MIPTIPTIPTTGMRGQGNRGERQAARRNGRLAAERGRGMVLEHGPDGRPAWLLRLLIDAEERGAPLTSYGTFVGFLNPRRATPEMHATVRRNERLLARLLRRSETPHQTWSKGGAATRQVPKGEGIP
jgi:hypothetical protein